jgi:hypothetical protein
VMLRDRWVTLRARWVTPQMKAAPNIQAQLQLAARAKKEAEVRTDAFSFLDV